MHVAWNTANPTDTTAAIADLEAGINHFSIQPNPNDGRFSLNLELVSSQDLVVQILNAQGQIMYEIEDKKAIKLDQDLNLSGHAPGIYFLQVITESGTVGKKILLK